MILIPFKNVVPDVVDFFEIRWLIVWSKNNVLNVFFLIFKMVAYSSWCINRTRCRVFGIIICHGATREQTNTCQALTAVSCYYSETWSFISPEPVCRGPFVFGTHTTPWEMCTRSGGTFAAAGHNSFLIERCLEKPDAWHLNLLSCNSDAARTRVTVTQIRVA